MAGRIQKTPAREAAEKIYNNLKIELMNAKMILVNHSPGDGFSDFDVIRLQGSLENAVEVYGEVLGYITYDD